MTPKLSNSILYLMSVSAGIISWIIILVSGYSIFGLIIGLILVDLGLQALHITNQNIIFSKNPEGRNRVHTVYMVSFFIGGALGTTLGALAWETYKWTGVSILGLVLSVLIFFTHLLFHKA